MTSKFLPLPLCLLLLIPQRCLPNIITVGNIVRSNGIIYAHNIDTVNTGITVKECSDNDVAGADCPELSKTRPDGSPSDILTAVKTTKEPGRRWNWKRVRNGPVSKPTSPYKLQEDDEDDDEEDDDFEPTTSETLSTTTTSETVTETVTGEQRHGLPTTSSSTQMPLTSSSSSSSSSSSPTSSSPSPYSSSTSSGNVRELESTTEIQTTTATPFTTESTSTLSTLESTSTTEMPTSDSTSTTLVIQDTTSESTSKTLSSSGSTTESSTSTMQSTSDSTTDTASTAVSTSDSAPTTVPTSYSTTDLTSTSLSTLDSTRESTSTTLPTTDSTTESTSTTLSTSISTTDAIFTTSSISDSTTESSFPKFSTSDSATESTSITTAPTPPASLYTTLESKSTTEIQTSTSYKTTTTESLSQRDSKESTTSTESPTTSSTTNTPEPTAAPSSDGITPDVCNGCVMKIGTGYVAHPTDCSRFVICTNLGWKRLISVMPCPTGLYWNQQILTCDHPNNVQCGQDICSTNGYKAIPGNCRGYWECYGGRAVSKCCPPLLKFDAALGSCVPDVTCQNGCQGDASGSGITEKDRCRMRSVPEDHFSYEQKDTNGLWVRKKCPATTAFSQSNCACSFFIRAGNAKHDCRPELLLTFDNGTEDKSGKSVYVKNSGVRVHNGMAFFDGESQISIDRFTNAWFGKTLIIRLVYQHSGTPSRQGILCNDNCNVNPSVYVGTTDNCSTEFFVKTTESPGANFTVSMKQRDWQRVELLLHNGVLKGEVNGRSRGLYTQGPVETRQRALSIGKCGGTEGFTGVIDEVAVFTCKPKHPYNQADTPQTKWFFN